MDFARINKVGQTAAFLPVKKLSELELKKDYSISDIRTVQTKWGTRIVIDVENTFACFLPARFVLLFEKDDQLFQQMIAAARENNLAMEYRGTKFNNLEFKPSTNH